MNGKKSRRKMRFNMSKNMVYNLTCIFCFMLVSIGSVTYVDDGINQVTFRLSSQDFSIFKIIRIVFIIVGIETVSTFMMRFGK